MAIKLGVLVGFLGRVLESKGAQVMPLGSYWCLGPWVLCLVPVILVDDLDVLGEAQRFLKNMVFFLYFLTS